MKQSPSTIKHQYLVLVLMFSVLIPQGLEAGAWPRSKHSFYFKLSSSYLRTTREFNHRGNKLDLFQERIVYTDASFRDFAVTAYIEYGLFERFTLIGQLPFKSLTSKRTEAIGGGTLLRIATLHTVGLSDFKLLGRYALINGSFAVALQGGVKIPVGYDSKPGNDAAPLGTGKLDFETNVLIGSSFYPLPAYFTGGVGYRRRGGEFHDQYLLGAEVGYNIGNILFKVTFESTKSTVAPPDIVGAPVVSPLPGGGGALPNIIEGDQDIYKIMPSITYKLTRSLALEAEVFHSFAGKNTVAGTTFSLGIVFEN